MIGVFFEEMWPVLRSAAEKLSAYIASDAHSLGDELPGKTFTATPGFEALQTGEGALTHSFEIQGVSGRRMVVPYQIWMLQRLEGVLRQARATSEGDQAIARFLAQWPNGPQLLDLSEMLKTCRVKKKGARLYSAAH